MNGAALRRLIRKILPLAQPLDPAAQWNEICLHLVDDRIMRVANKAVFEQDAVTDVISQRYVPSPPDYQLTGEIIVNLQQACKAPNRPGWSPSRELALYIAHGIDHLHGADDATPKERQRMRRRELRWIHTLIEPHLVMIP